MHQTLSSLSDQKIVRLCQEGNHEAFGVIAQRYSKDIKKSLLVIIPDDRTLVDDLVQDTLIRALISIRDEKYAHNGKLVGWLIRLARNIAVDHFRKIHRKPVHIDIDTDLYDNTIFVDTNTTAEEKIIIKEEILQYWNLIRVLPEEQRDVISLRILTKLKFKEIGFMMDGCVSTNTAVGRMRYARRNIKKLLKEVV